MNKKEKMIIEEALETANQTLESTFFYYEILQKRKESDRLQLRSHSGDLFVFRLVIQEKINHALINQLGEEKYPSTESADEPWLLLTLYVSEPMGKRLVELGINYLDRAGNMYCRAPGLMLWIKGNKPVQKVAYQKPKAFQGNGIKLLWHLLNNPDLFQAKYRDLATISAISLGSISQIFANLMEMEFLVESGGGKILINRKRLLEKFLVGFVEYLKPKLQIQRYRTAKKSILNDWQNMQLNQYHALWGGEAAAYFYMPTINPQHLIIYTEKNNRLPLLKALQAIPDPRGEIEIRNIFWPLPANTTQMATVPPLLIYTDLRDSEHSRNQEIAQQIYESYLSDFFEKG